MLGRAVRKLSCWPVRFGNGLENAVKRVLISGTICRQGADILLRSYIRQKRAREELNKFEFCENMTTTINLLCVC